MRIIIAGSRAVSKQDVFKAIQSCPWINFISSVVSGTAKGADNFGEEWAKANGIEICRYPAEWDKYGKSAGPKRNEVMAKNAEGLIAVWDGKSRGTHSMIDLAQKYGLKIFVFRFDKGSTEQITPSGNISFLWEDAEERAAIIEYDEGVPKQDAERQAGLLVLTDKQQGTG